MAKVEIVGNEIMLREDAVNGDHSASITAPSSLSSSVRFTLPSTGGTIATEEYVSNNVGGDVNELTPTRLSADWTTTDEVGTTVENVTGFTVALEADTLYELQGCFHWYDPSASQAGKVGLSVPSGASYRILGAEINHNAVQYQYSDVAVSGTITTMISQNYDGDTSLHVMGIVKTAGTAGNLQVTFTNTFGAGAPAQGLRAGSYIKLRK